MNVLKTILAFTLMPIAFMAPLAQAESSTQLLGVTYLTRAEADRDVLRFATCRGGIRALQIKVQSAPAELELVRVNFRNGERELLSVRSRIAKGGSSRWIDLSGGDRCIDSIVVIGDSEGSRRQSKVKVFGR
jgi:hypothetical protein